MYPLIARVSSDSVDFVLVLGTRLILNRSRLNNRSFVIVRQQARKKHREVDLTVFLSRPKMADVRDAILCFLVVFLGAES